MTEPASPTPAPVKLSLVDRVKAAVLWALSPAGRKDVGALLAAATALYTALHRAGV